MGNNNLNYQEIPMQFPFPHLTLKSHFPLLIGSRWRYEWDDSGFNAPTSEVYRLLCQKGEDFYFSRARYIYGSFADSEVGKMIAAQRKEGKEK